MNSIFSILNFDSFDPQWLEKAKNATVSFGQYAKFAGIVLFGLLLLSSLFRFLFGKKAQIQIAITSAIEIFFVYVVAVVSPALLPDVNIFIAPLPLVTLAEDYLVFFPVLEADFSVLCDHLLRLLMIAFLVNLLCGLLPRGRHLISWLVQRLLVVACSIALIYLLHLALSTFLPQGFSDKAPMILLIVLAVLIVLGSLKLLVGTAIAFANPLLGVLYTFFFCNLIGRALSRAILTTALLAGLVAALNSLGIYGFPVSADVLKGCIPLLVITVGLWYLISHLFVRDRKK